MYNDFSDSLKEQIYSKIEKIINETKGPHYAAFDADGTLWDTDIGEVIFDYLIKYAGLNLPEDPWGHYHQLKKEHPPTAYIWLAQILEGKEISEVKTLCKTAILNFERNKPVPTYPAQKELIKYLHTKGVKVFVVTASVKWSVEYAASYYNIPEENVLGVKTKIIHNKVSSEQDGPITYREGKAQAILEATNNIKPILCAGNTEGDIELLECSSNIKLAVRSHGQSEELFPTEQKLNTTATNNNWLTHKFR